MCGIAGYCRSPEAISPAPDLKRMTRMLYHRGPDEEGYYENGTVGLGMRRLSIIDLNTGQQPIANETGTVQVVFNGEIYNYQELRQQLIARGHHFKTHSDTEVLVHGYEEWNTELPTHLRGMFAFAIWDAREHKLFIARDHFGIKPLYYSSVGGTLVFGSEIKSLLQHTSLQRELDPLALHQYLSFLYVPEPRTIFKGIHALSPAHALLWQRGRLKTWRYWQCQPHLQRFASRDQAEQAIRAAFADSVRKMMIADVPLGVFLSGGMDSVSILAMMAPHSAEPVKTFTIGFGEREKNWDEMALARRVAQHFATDHHEFRVRPDIVSLIPEVIGHFDQPFANPTAVILYLLSGETRRHVKVALSGTGGDEMFAGYPRYLGMQLYQHYSRLPRRWRENAARLAETLGHDATDGKLGRQRLRRFLQAGTQPFADTYAQLMAVIEPHRKRALYTSWFDEQVQAYDEGAFITSDFDPAAANPAEQLLAVDLSSYLPFNQLVYADRMSMAQSLEVRVPFVDQELAAIAADIPLQWKLPRGQTKGLFRRAMAPFIPPDIVNAPKRGLNLPIALWFRGELRSWLADLLSEERLSTRGYFKPAAVTGVMQEHFQGRRDHSLFLWALAMLELWQQSYVDGNRDSAVPASSLGEEDSRPNFDLALPRKHQETSWLS